MISYIPIFVIVILLFVHAIYGYPLSVGDKQWFYPVIFNLKNSRDLIHPFLHPFSLTDLRFNWHGFMFPIIQEKFNIFNDYYRIDFSSVCLIFVNSSLLFIFLLVNFKKQAVDKWISVLFLPSVALSIYTYQAGRPELVISTFLLLDCFIRRKDWDLGYLYEAFISATLLVISPISFILHYLFWMSVSKDSKGFNSKLRIYYYGLVPVFVFIYFEVFVVNFNFFEWIQGITSHASGMTFYSSSWSWKIYSGYLWGEPKIPYVILAICYCLLVFAENSRGAINNIAALLFILFSYWYAIREPVHIYNIIVFIPMFIILDIFYSRGSIFFIRWPKVIILVFFSITCINALIYETILGAFSDLRYGIPPSALVKSMQDVPADATIETRPCFYLIDQFQHKKIINTSGFAPDNKYNGDFVFLPQFEIGSIKRDNIPQIPGYCVVDYSIHFYPSKMFYDWAFIKYKKCNS